MKLKKSDIVLIGVVGFVLIAILIMSDRYYKITGYYANRVKNGDECVEVRLNHCEIMDIPEVVLTEKDDIKICIDSLNKLKLRKRDFIDDFNMYIREKGIVDEGCFGGCNIKYITLEFEDGKNIDISFYLSKNNNNIGSEVYYDGKEYFAKGKVPQELWDLFYDE